MKPFRLLSLVLLIGAAMMMSGCMVGYHEYLFRTYKPPMNAFTDTRYETREYKVLGHVQAEVASVCILGVYVAGKDGQGALMEEAKDEYQECTGLKDVCMLHEYEGVVPPIYMKIRTTFYGLAVAE